MTSYGQESDSLGWHTGSSPDHLEEYLLLKISNEALLYYVHTQLMVSAIVADRLAGCGERRFGQGLVPAEDDAGDAPSKLARGEKCCLRCCKKFSQAEECGR